MRAAVHTARVRLPPMRPRSTTLVSWPAPPARGAVSRPLGQDDEHDEHDDLDGEVVLALSRRREPSEPPVSETRLCARAPDARAQAATVAAASLVAGLDARAVIVHAHDPGTHELRVVGVWGENVATLLGEAEVSDDDFVASTVIGNGHPMTMLLGGGLPRVAPRRLAVVGAERSLFALPILSEGVCVGLIEVVDVDPSLTARVAKACAAVAESLAPSL
jgi:hypothetical protein